MIKMKKRSAGLVLSYLNTFINMITGLFLSSFLLKKLGATEYGVYQIISSFANYLVLLEFGTGTVMARNILSCKAQSKGKEEIEKNISTIWAITNILALIIILVSAIFFFSIDFIYSNSLTALQLAEGKKIFVFITVFLLASFYIQTLGGIALGYEDYTYSSALSIVKMLSRTVLIIVFVSKIKSSLTVAVIDAAVIFVLAIYSYFYCHKKFGVTISSRYFDKAVLHTSLPLCMALFLQTIVNQANNTIGKFILGIMAKPSDVATYSVGLYVFSIFSSISTIPISLYMPQVSKDVLSGLKGKELTKTLIQPCRLIVIVSGTVLFGFIAAGKQFVSIVYGLQYISAWWIAIILIFPMFINMSNGIVINILDVKNKRHIRSIILLITALLNIIMTYFFIKSLGIIGAAIATAVSTLIQVLIINIYYYRAIDIKVVFLFAYSYKGILIFQILGSILGYLAGNIIQNQIISFLVSGATYVIIAFGGFLLVGANSSEKSQLKAILNKFTSFKSHRS